MKKKPDTKKQKHDNILGLKLAQQLSYHHDIIFNIAWSPDGRYLASGSHDKTIVVWDVETGTQFQYQNGNFGSVFGVSWSPDGEKIAFGLKDIEILILKVNNIFKFKTLTGHTDTVYCLSWSPDGRFLASGDYERLIWLWDIENPGRTRTLSGHRGAVTAWPGRPTAGSSPPGLRIRTFGSGEPLEINPAWPL